MLKREVLARIGAGGLGRVVAALAVAAGLASLGAFAAAPAAARHDLRGGQPDFRAHRSRARGGCNATSITGITQNETGHPLRLVHARHGITNTWCTRPSNEVPADSSSNHWRAGDDLFQTEVHLAYSFGHSMEVQFTALTGSLGRGTTLRCGFLTPVPPPYGCEAKLARSGPKAHPHVIFRVFPKP